MKVTCPDCGHVFNFQARAKMGKGTQRTVKLNFNRVNIIRAVRTIRRPCTVREVQYWLHGNHITRKGRKGMSGWNYHQVQADLSLLVGNGYLKMTTVPQEGFDEQGFKATPTPRYEYVEGSLNGPRPP